MATVQDLIIECLDKINEHYKTKSYEAFTRSKYYNSETNCLINNENIFHEVPEEYIEDGMPAEMEIDVSFNISFEQFLLNNKTFYDRISIISGGMLHFRRNDIDDFTKKLLNDLELISNNLDIEDFMKFEIDIYEKIELYIDENQTNQFLKSIKSHFLEFFKKKFEDKFEAKINAEKYFLENSSLKFTLQQTELAALYHLLCDSGILDNQLDKMLFVRFAVRHFKVRDSKKDDYYDLVFKNFNSTVNKEFTPNFDSSAIKRVMLKLSQAYFHLTNELPTIK